MATTYTDPPEAIDGVAADVRLGATREGSVELTLEDERRGDWLVVRVAGELDLHTSPQLRDHVLSRIGDASVRIALDLTGVGFMDSSSLGMLVTCLKRVRERDVELVLVGVSGSPMKVFTLTGLDRVFELLGSADELT